MRGLGLFVFVVLTIAPIAIAGGPKEDAAKKRADARASAQAAKDAATKEKVRLAEMRKKAAAAAKDDAGSPQSFKVTESENLGLRIWRADFGPAPGEYYAWRIKYRAKNDDGATEESEWCVLFDGNLNVKGVVGYPSAGHLAEKGEPPRKQAKSVGGAKSPLSVFDDDVGLEPKNDDKRATEDAAILQAKAVESIKSNVVGEPESLKVIDSFDLGLMRWLAADGPENDDYRVIRIKFRAKNDTGAMQIFDLAVLFNAECEAAGIVSYPSRGKLLRLDEPSLNDVLLELAKPGGMRDKGEQKPKKR